jgi:hypothetical protein
VTSVQGSGGFKLLKKIQAMRRLLLQVIIDVIYETDL